MNERADAAAGSASAENYRIPTESYKGVFKLIAQVSRGLISPEAFLQDFYTAYKEIEAGLRDTRERLAGLEADGDGKRYLERLSDDIECCAYIFRLALMQFEAFVNREEPTGLRIGTQLMEKARSAFEETVKGVQARAEGRSLDERRDAVGALAAEAVNGKISLDLYRQALDRLQAVFEPLEENCRVFQEEIVKGAKELVDCEDDAEELKKRGAQLLPKILKLADAYGLMILSVHAPDYTRRSIGNLMLGEEVKDSDKL